MSFNKINHLLFISFCLLDSIVFASFIETFENRIDLKSEFYLNNDDSTIIYKVVEQMPKFPGGDEGMIMFFDDYIIKPDAVRAGNLEGSVYVSIVIDENGKVLRKKIVKNLCETCDEEVMRVLSAMPNWIPGKQNGKNVKVELVIPVKFTKDSREIQLFKLAKQNFEEGNYIMADTIYSRIIRKYSTNEAFYDRALTKLKLGNELDYCKDLYKAMGLKSQDALIKYNESCLKYDSLFKAMKEKEDKNVEVFEEAEIMPEYLGGQEGFFKYLKENIKYPKSASDAGIHGTVYVSFIVNKFGDVSNVKIVRGLNEACDKEALRVVSNMGKWKPGIQDGKKVSVHFHLPISFTMKSTKNLRE